MRYDAIILGLSGTGLAVARALGRRGLRIAGVDPRRWEIGHSSRYVVSSTKATIDELLRLAGGDQPILFACGDPEIRWVCANANRLSPKVRLPPSYLDGSATRAVNKRQYYVDCLRLEVPIARTWIPKDESDLKAIASEARFPVLIKPDSGRVIQCNEKQTLLRSVPNPTTVVVQEMLPGTEDNLQVFAGHLGRNGSVGPRVTATKLRQYPRHIGSGSRLITTEDAEVEEKSIALLKALGLSGPCGVEWKRVGNRLIHIETNPRPVLWYGLAEAIVWDAWCDLSGEEGDVERPASEHVAHQVGQCEGGVVDICFR